MGLTEKEQQKIHQNESENNVYKVQLDKFFEKQMQTHEIINVCSTPNILKIFNSTARKVVLSQSDLENAVSSADLGNKGHREGHDIAKSEIYKLPESIRSPILMLKGNSRNSNSVVMLTEMINKKGENVFVPIALDRQKGKISDISTMYGKKNLSKYLSDHLSDILAINIKKADMLANIGVQFPKSIYDTVVCFDNSIAYSTANVKYPDKKILKGAEKEMTEQEMQANTPDIAHTVDERIDNMAENAKYSIFQISTHSETTFFKDSTSSDINDTLKRYADCDGFYLDFIKDCERISEVEFAELKQSGEAVFCAEINVDNDLLTVWDAEKVAQDHDLENVLNNLKDHGTLDLNYKTFKTIEWEEENDEKLFDLDYDDGISPLEMYDSFDTEETAPVMTEKENFCLFTVEIYGEVMEYRDNTTSDINALMNRYVECEGNLPSFTENCTQISSVEFAELEQYYNPLFCAKINIDENSFSVWDNEKFADESLENVISSIKENGTVNLDYQEFAKINDTDELTIEYLDFSESLDNAYDDFLYHNGIFNDEHIAFVDKHGQLPDDLNTANNRDIVTEYINIQLESGSNLSESQKETLIELKNQISEIKEMETKLGIDENDLSFIAETKNACAWTNEAQKKIDERNAGLDNQNRDDPF